MVLLLGMCVYVCTHDGHLQLMYVLLNRVQHNAAVVCPRATYAFMIEKG